jgi:curved DNA-binding protein CbpA
MINHFRVLRVTTTATPDDLRRAKKERALETHPDRGGTVADFDAVTTAYETLADPIKRRDWERAYTAHAGTLGHTVCPLCFAVNRVRALQAGQIARCAACRTELRVSEEERRAQYADALKSQVGDLILTIGAETGSLAQDAIKAGAKAIRKKLGIDKGG